MLSLLLGSSLLLAAAPPIDAQALRAHLDQTVPARMEESGVTGVVVSVVQGDRLVLAEGWGLADVDAGRPMDGHDTVVRIASITKTFTATAVARLEARGALSVDEPVERYLNGVGFPPGHEPPVTLRHLLSHTAGIINNNVGRVTRQPVEADGMAPFIVATMPPQVRAPGRVVLYSNHGNALAGLAVERVTGQRFEEHIDEVLLGPLRMGDSALSLTPALAERLAVGYTLDAGEPTPYELIHFRTTPASSLYTTATDIAAFMSMQLQGGRYQGQQVIPAEAIATMRRPVPMIDPALPTYHYAFAHGHLAGHPMRSHGGSIPAFLSKLVLFDEQGVGVFVCQNSFGESLSTGIVESIAEQFLPAPVIPPLRVQGDGRPEAPEELVGSYRRADKTDTPAFTRGVALLMSTPLSVGLDDEGFLIVDGDRFLRTGPLVFGRERESRVPEVLVFVRDEAGTVRWAHRGLASAERPPWYESRWLQLPLLGAALLLLGLASVRRVPWRRRPELEPARLRWSVLAARLCLLGAVLPFVYVAWVDAGQVPYLRPMRFGEPGWMPWLRALMPLGAVLAWAGVARLARGDRRGLRAALVIALACTVPPLFQLAWRTPPPGLVQR